MADWRELIKDYDKAYSTDAQDQIDFKVKNKIGYLKNGMHFMDLFGPTEEQKKTINWGRDITDEDRMASSYNATIENNYRDNLRRDLFSPTSNKSVIESNRNKWQEYLNSVDNKFKNNTGLYPTDEMYSKQLENHSSDLRKELGYTDEEYKNYYKELQADKVGKTPMQEVDEELAKVNKITSNSPLFGNNGSSFAKVSSLNYPNSTVVREIDDNTILMKDSNGKEFYVNKGDKNPVKLDSNGNILENNSENPNLKELKKGKGLIGEIKEHWSNAEDYIDNKPKSWLSYIPGGDALRTLDRTIADYSNTHLTEDSVGTMDKIKAEQDNNLSLAQEHIKQYGYLPKDATDKQIEEYYKPLGGVPVQSSMGRFNYALTNSVAPLDKSPSEFLYELNSNQNGNKVANAVADFTGGMSAMFTNPGFTLGGPGTNLLNITDNMAQQGALKVSGKLGKAGTTKANAIGNSILRNGARLTIDGAMGGALDTPRLGQGIDELPENVVRGAVGALAFGGAIQGGGALAKAGKEAFNNLPSTQLRQALKTPESNNFTMGKLDSSKNTLNVDIDESGINNAYKNGIANEKNYGGKSYNDLKSEQQATQQIPTTVKEKETLNAIYQRNKEDVLAYMRDNNVDVDKAQQDLGIDLVKMEDEISKIQDNNEDVVAYRKIRAEYDNAKSEITNYMKENNLSEKNPSDITKAEEMTGINIKEIQKRLNEAEDNILDYGGRITKTETVVSKDNPNPYIHPSDKAEFDKINKEIEYYRSEVERYAEENNISYKQAEEETGYKISELENELANLNSPQRVVKREAEVIEAEAKRYAELNGLTEREALIEMGYNIDDLGNRANIYEELATKQRKITPQGKNLVGGKNLIKNESGLVSKNSILNYSKENIETPLSKSEIIGGKDTFDNNVNRVESGNPIYNGTYKSRKYNNKSSEYDSTPIEKGYNNGDVIDYGNSTGKIVGFDSNGKIIVKDTDGTIKVISHYEIKDSQQISFINDSVENANKISKSEDDTQKQKIEEMAQELGLTYTKAEGLGSGNLNKYMEDLKGKIYKLDNIIIEAEKKGRNTTSLKERKAELVNEFKEKSRNIEINQNYSFSKIIGVDKDGKAINGFKTDEEKYIYKKSEIEEINEPIENVRNELLDIDRKIIDSYNKGTNADKLLSKRNELVKKFIELKDSIEDKSKYIADEQLEASRDEFGNINLGQFLFGDEAKGNVFQQVGFKQGIKELWNFVYKKIMTSNNATEQVSKKTGQMKNAINNVDRKVQVRLARLEPIIKEVPTKNRQEAINFYHYVVHRMNITRAKDGTPVAYKIDPEKSYKEAKRLATENPHFVKIADDLSKKLLIELEDILVGSGTMSKADWDKIVSKNSNGADGFYMPLERIVKEAIAIDTPWAKIKGNYKGDYLNVIESYVNVIERSVKYAEANKVGQQLLSEIEEGKLQGVARVVKSSDRIVKGENIYKVRRDGEIVQIAIKNEELFSELSNMYSKSNGKKISNSKFVNALFEKSGNAVNWGSKAITKGLTQYNPGWGGMNAIKDGRRYLKYTSEKNYLKSISTYLQALGEVFGDRITKTLNDYTGTNFKRSAKLMEFDELGGRDANFITNIDSSGRARELMGLKPTDSTPVKIAKGTYRVSTYPIRLLGKIITTINNDIETIPRYAENLNVIRNGGSKLDGVLAAQEITGNFARSGTLGKQINKVYPFFNSTLQGMDRFGRMLGDKEKRFQWAKKSVYEKATMSALAYLSAQMFSKDKDEYKREYDELSSRTKDNNYNLYIGNGEFLKLAKATDVDMLIILAERVYRAVDKQDPQVFFDGLGGTLKEAYEPPYDIRRSALVSPYFDLEKNKDFLKRDIEPSYMEGWANKEKYNESTSELAKWLGEKMNLSPIKIDFVMKNYFGVRYEPVANWGDTLGETASNTFDKVIGRRFIADTKYDNKYSNDYYEYKKDIEDAESTLTSHTRVAKLNGDDKILYNDLKSMGNKYEITNKQIQKLYDRIAEEKDKSKIDALYLQIANLRKQFIERNKKELEKLK